MKNKTVIRYVVFTTQKNTEVVLRCCLIKRDAERFLKKLKSDKAWIRRVVFDGGSTECGYDILPVQRMKQPGYLNIMVPSFKVEDMTYEFEVGMAFEWANSYVHVLQKD